MNSYGQLALEHWRTHRPAALASMADPEGHFDRLGTVVETQVGDLRDQILGGQRPGEDLEAYRLRSYQARRQAQEVVLGELVWVEPEPGTDSEDEEEDEVLAAYYERLRAGSEMLATLANWGGDPQDEGPPA